MSRIRWALRWVFVRGPAAFHELAESRWNLTWLVSVGGMALAGGLGAGVGALVGVLGGKAVSGAALVGGLVGLGVACGWLVMSVLSIGILWVRGISPASAAAGGREPRGRHAGRFEAGWRRRGEPLVPVSLVGFFLLMTLCFGFLAGQSWKDSRAWDEATAVVDGTVVEIFEPGLADRGSGDVLVRYVASGAEYKIEVERDPGEHFLRLDDVLPIEYAVARPSRARAVWAVEAARSDLGIWAVITGSCGVLAIASGAGYLKGKRRASPKPSTLTWWSSLIRGTRRLRRLKGH